MVRCIVMFLLRWENFTSISLRGFKERCQYLHKDIRLVYHWLKLSKKKKECFFCQTHRHVPTGLGSTTPAVYTAWKMPCKLTRLVISLIKTGATRLERSFLWTHRKFISTIFFSLKNTRGTSVLHLRLSASKKLYCVIFMIALSTIRKELLIYYWQTF